MGITEDISTANRNYPQARIWGNHLMPVRLDALVSIGATGAPTLAAANGLGITSITRMSAGKYRIRLQDNFAKLIGFRVTPVAATTGGNVAAGSLSVGTVYQITAMGTTTQANWVTAGLPSGITAAVGVTFKCAATTSGNGTAAAIGTSGVVATELIGTNVNMLNSQPYSQGNGGYIDFQCVSGTLTMNAYTPAGTNSAPAFTGSALGTHTHDILIIGGQAAASTDAVSAKAGPILGKESATNATIAGSASATNGGVVAVSAGTPAGTVAAPIFTGTQATLTGTVSMTAADPTNGASLLIEIMLNNSQVQ